MQSKSAIDLGAEDSAESGFGAIEDQLVFYYTGCMNDTENWWET
jgi:hypothetical protein